MSHTISSTLPLVSRLEVSSPDICHLLLLFITFTSYAGLPFPKAAYSGTNLCSRPFGPFRLRPLLSTSWGSFSRYMLVLQDIYYGATTILVHGVVSKPFFYSFMFYFCLDKVTFDYLVAVPRVALVLGSLSDI